MTYLPAIFFIGMIAAGQQDIVIGVPMVILCAVGFGVTARRLTV